MILAIIFVVLVTLCVLFISVFSKKRNLIPFVALSAGGLFSLTFLDFLPHSFSQGIHEASLLIFLGVLVQMFFELYVVKHLNFLDRYLGNDSHNHSGHSHIVSSLAACSVSGCLTICSFFDGMRFFAGLSINASVGILTSAGVFFHLLSHGVLASLFNLNSGFRMKAVLALSSCICGSFVLGAFVANNIAYSFSEAYMQAFATGILLYVCFLHLIPLALKPENRKWFFLGLVLFALTHFWH